MPSSPAMWEMRFALSGTLRLARGDATALSCFVASNDGFWRSFRAAAICYPLYLLLVAYRITIAQVEAVGEGRILAIETIAYVISWAAYPLLMLPLSRWLDRENRFLLFMVAYNWSQVPQTVLFVVVGTFGISGLLPQSAGTTLDFAAAVAALVYAWYIARVALSTSGGQACLVILVDVLLGSTLSRITDALYRS